MQLFESLEVRRLLFNTAPFEGTILQTGSEIVGVAFAGDNAVYEQGPVAEIFAEPLANTGPRVQIDPFGLGVVTLGDQAYFPRLSDLYRTDGTPAGTGEFLPSSPFPEGGPNIDNTLAALGEKLLVITQPDLVVVDPADQSVTTLIDDALATGLFSGFDNEYVGFAPGADDFLFLRSTDSLWAITGDGSAATLVADDTRFDDFRPVGKSAGKHVILASEDDITRFWSKPDNGALLLTAGLAGDAVEYDIDGDGNLNDQFVDAAVTLPDGTLLIGGSSDGNYGLWTAPSADDPATLTLPIASDDLLPLIRLGDKAVFAQGQFNESAFARGAVDIFTTDGTAQGTTLVESQYFFGDFQHVVQGKTRIIFGGEDLGWSFLDVDASEPTFITNLPLSEFAEAALRVEEVLLGLTDIAGDGTLAYWADGLPGGPSLGVADADTTAPVAEADDATLAEMPGVSFTFDEPIAQAALSVVSTTGANIDADDFELAGFGTDTVTATYKPNGNVTPLPNGRFIATLVGPTDAAGNIGADIAVNFSFLQGDLDGDGNVDLLDAALLERNFCRSGDAIPFSDGDLDYDDDVDLTDAALLERNFGGTLPTPPAIVAGGRGKLTTPPSLFGNRPITIKRLGDGLFGGDETAGPTFKPVGRDAP